MRSPFESRSRPFPRLLGGCAAAAVAASLAAPQAAHGQAFNATPIYMTPGVTVTDSANSSTIATTTGTGIIDWSTAGDTGAPFTFLPAGNTATFTSGASGNDYIILNRIFGQDPTSPMQFDGTVISEIRNAGVPGPGGTVWFSTSGGIILGSGAVFDVGSLILTSQEILTLETTGDSDPDEIDFGPNGEIQFGATITDSTSSVTIQPGATIDAANLNGSYVALVAPRIDMGGTVNVDGSAAYVAAEALDILINNGLFDITITTGTFAATPDEQVITHSGSTGGPSNISLADTHAIYMVAVPKNEAVTMLVSGDVGYQPAVTVGVENGVIYLSAGDDGFGPVTTDFTRIPGSGVAPPGAAQGSVSIENATVTSRFQAFASNAINLVSITPDASFALDAALFAGNSVNVTASGSGNALQFGGDLVVAANNFEQGGAAELRAEDGATLTVLGDALIDVSDTVHFVDNIEQGGSATISAIGGDIVISGDLTIDASGIGDDLDAPPEAEGIGGTVLIGAAGGDIVVSGDLSARADGIGADYLPSYSYYSYAGGDGTGGVVELYASGGAIEVDGTGGLDLGAAGFGGDGNAGGGTGNGGQIFVSSEADGAITVVSELNASAIGVGGDGVSGAFGGEAIGGFVDVLVAGDASLQTASVVLDASAAGGSGGAGGDAAGGFVTLTGGAGSGQFAADTSDISADASGGAPPSGTAGAGDALAGVVNVASNGAAVGLGDATISASGFSTDGSSIGGTISLSATGGLITAGDIGMFASGINSGGTGAGGLVTITALDDGSGSSGTLAFGATSLSAHGDSSVAGQSTAGNISINNLASDPSRTITFASLDAQALGDNPATDPAIQIGADTAAILVAGNANFSGAGDVIFHIAGTGFFDAGSLTAAATGLIEITHFSPPAGSDALIARDSIAMSADAGILVQGGLLVDSANSGSGVFLDGQTFVRVITPTGRIRVLDGSGNLAGSIELGADDIFVGSPATSTALDSAASIAEREAILGANDGPVNMEGYLQANAITLTGGDSIYVQNSGVDGGLPDERAGFTAGAGGLTLQTSGAEPTEIIVNGRIVSGGAVVTGSDVIDAATIEASGGGAADFASASTINSCLILGGNCAVTPPPPPHQASFDVPVRDLVEREIEDNEEESTETRRRPVPPLIETVDLGGGGPPPMIDDPVTGTGNDDLWNAGDPPGGTD